MNVALVALLALVAPPSARTDVFRFGIRPDAGATYRYKNSLTSDIQFEGQSGSFGRELIQQLDVLRRDKFGFEILITTQSAALRFPEAMKMENAKAKEIGKAMAEKLVLGAVFQADGQLKNYVTYTEGDHQKTADDLAQTSFGFVLVEMHKGPMKVGDAYSTPVDFSQAAASLAKSSMAIDPNGPTPRQVWTLKSFETKGGRREVHFAGKLKGTLRLVGVDGAKPAIDEMTLKADAAAVFDVRTGMLISLRSKLNMTAEGGRDKALDIAVDLSTTLLNPSALNPAPAKR